MVNIKSEKRINQVETRYLGMTTKGVKKTFIGLAFLSTFVGGATLGTVYGRDVVIALTKPGTYEKLQIQSAKAEGISVGKDSGSQSSSN